ncbi:uncharacterized protein SGFS_102660 [Streptomyces graminofaciens]|uniref:DUF4352 domain-containing protein n=1 Tax=Streptomyces graminofaciens TaxID=68212 RepID=A0ABM7FSB2_9ACTN|nr:hypothetical protein [Streptomyces graminofaciens]BBC38972.1 uncharacterized protein SGFS_102660 [Streptomyces graminofaciens]
MREPNVIGDWQEYDGDLAGLRVRVHGVERAEPPKGRDDATEGQTYFRFRVTVENRGADDVCVHLEDGQLDIRTGPDGESAFLDWRNSQFIEGFDVYPLRRATAVLYAAASEACLTHLDIQVQLRADEEWADRHLWSGGIGIGIDEDFLDPATGTAREGIAGQVSAFLHEEAERGAG